MDAAQIGEVRKANLRALSKQWDGPKRLTTRLGWKDSSYLCQMMGKQRPVSDAKAREIEKALGLPQGWMDRKMSAAGVPSSDTAVINECVAALNDALKEYKVDVSHAKYGHLIAIMARDASRGGFDPEFAEQLAAMLKA